jgi:hypothetical protein
MWKRIVAAVKVLAGVRPAEVQYEELDERIAERCAGEAADVIAAHVAPPEADKKSRAVLRWHIAMVVYDAIERYAGLERVPEPLSCLRCRPVILRSFRKPDDQVKGNDTGPS